MNSKRRTRQVKLTLRTDGRYCARIIGKIYYLGRDYSNAMGEHSRITKALKAGQYPSPAVVTPSRATVKDVSDRFLFKCLTRKNAGTMKGGTFDDYFDALSDFAGVADIRGVPLRGVAVDDLVPDDFAAARSLWSVTRKLGPWALDRNVQAVRTMFNDALKHRLIERQPFYADSFHKSASSEKQAKRHAAERERGYRKFTVKEIKALVGKAKGAMRAFVLLGLNGGMYAADVAGLRTADIQKEDRQWVVNIVRNKTLIRWKFVLWPETLKAIRAAQSTENESGLLFLTVHGNPWHREQSHARKRKPGVTKSSDTNSIALMFNRLLNRIGIKRDGVGFGAFRATHTSAVGSHPDRTAQKWVRGHKVDSIEHHYDVPEIARLKSVTDLAHALLKRNSSARRQTSE